MIVYRLKISKFGDVKTLCSYSSYGKAHDDFEFALSVVRFIGSDKAALYMEAEEVPDNGV